MSKHPRSKARGPLVPKSRLARLSAVAVAFAIAGCGSTPAARIHSLLGSDAVNRAPASSGRTGGAFILESIRVPPSVDQPQWLVRLPDDSLASLESERWASPLRDEFRQAVLVGLTSRFGWVDARDDRTFAATAWRVRIDVLRFESIAGREARIEGTWTLTAPSVGTVMAPDAAVVPPGTRPASSVHANPATPTAMHCEWRFAQTASGGMLEVAEAHRRNVTQLTDALGDALGRLQRGEPARCMALP